MKMYLDAEAVVESEKTVTFNNISFEEPAPAPTGLYFTAQPSGVTLLENEDAGWDVSWNNDTPSWRNVNFVINNYETAYDVLKVSITATAGTNVGIWWNYGEDAHANVRNHYAAEGVVGETGTLELVFLAKAFGI